MTLTPIHIHDEVLESQRDIRAMKSIARKVLRADGGTWDCQTGCGRRISLNKILCRQCAEKAESA